MKAWTVPAVLGALAIALAAAGSTLAHDSDDEMIYAALAAKVERTGLSAYNLRDLSIQPDGELWRVDPEPGGNLLALMSASGVTHYDTPFYFNPPLYPALVALSHRLFSRSEAFHLAKRDAPNRFRGEQLYLVIPNALMAVLFLWGVYLLAGTVLPDDARRWAVLFTAISPVLLVTAFKNWSDLTAASLIVFALWLRDRDRKPAPAAAIVSALLLALAVWTRTASVLAVPLFLKRPWKFTALWAAVFAVVAGIWFSMVAAHYGNPFYFPESAAGAGATEWMRSIRRPAYYYLVDLITLSPLFLFSLAAFGYASRKYFAWFLCFFVPLSILAHSSKALGVEDRYLLPCYPAMAILAARGFKRAEQIVPRFWLRTAVCVLALWSLSTGARLVASRESLLFLPEAQAEGSVREPAVAGSFYPADAAELSRTIDGFLKKVPADVRAETEPKALIVPHAGYEYSGRTAAYAFKQLEGRHYETVILIGVCHRIPLAGASVWTDGSWKTPLGETPVHAALAHAIQKEDKRFNYGMDAHAAEHSLEVELPFLQSTLKNFNIVPILISDPSDAYTDALARAVAKHIRNKNVLVVASSDMSHYRTDERTRPMDARALDYIRKGDAAGLFKAAREDRVELCGIAPVLTVLKVARLMRWAPPQVLHYSTSADATGDKRSVVGYGASLIGTPVPRAPLTQAEKSRLMQIARSTLDRFVRLGERPVIDEKDPALREVRGAFVTLKDKKGLRGCIGTIVGVEPLAVTVSRMAVSAASEDPRFPPVRPEELKNIRVEISVLSPLERVRSIEAVVTGRHGVLVRNGAHQGVFLPQVADETGWTRDEFMSQLCTQKAGLPDRCWEDPATELYVFETENVS